MVLISCSSNLGGFCFCSQTASNAVPNNPPPATVDQYQKHSYHRRCIGTLQRFSIAIPTSPKLCPLPVPTVHTPRPSAGSVRLRNDQSVNQISLVWFRPWARVSFPSMSPAGRPERGKSMGQNRNHAWLWGMIQVMLLL